MNDFANLEKTIVRELSCRLCLCTDVVKLKPLSAEVKRKIKRLFDIMVRLTWLGGKRASVTITHWQVMQTYTR